MSTLPSDMQVLVGVAFDFAAGTVLGVLYFRSLVWIVGRLTGDGRMPTTVVLMILRFIALGGFLTLASFAGALHLLVMTIGVFVGRSAVVRGTREAAS